MKNLCSFSKFSEFIPFHKAKKIYWRCRKNYGENIYLLSLCLVLPQFNISATILLTTLTVVDSDVADSRIKVLYMRLASTPQTRIFFLRKASLFAQITWQSLQQYYNLRKEKSRLIPLDINLKLRYIFKSLSTSSHFE